MATRPLPMGMTPTSAPPPDGGGLPGSPVGGPGGPGATPMLSPGNNAGVKASAAAKIKACMRNIQIASLAYDPGSKEFNACVGALRTLNGVFGKPSDQDLDPAARASMAAPPPSPLAGMAPAGMSGGPGGGGSSPTPPPPPPPGGPPGNPMMGGGTPGGGAGDMGAM